MNTDKETAVEMGDLENKLKENGILYKTLVPLGEATVSNLTIYTK